MSPKESPILFSAPMVRAILDGRKTQTRRVHKDQYRVKEILKRHQLCEDKPETLYCYDCLPCSYGQPGDRLWVRETWMHCQEEDLLIYRADDPFCKKPSNCRWCSAVENKWKPSIHMPRKASRILLEITDIRVERLQDISREDALAEGIADLSHLLYSEKDLDIKINEPVEIARFRSLWHTINKEDGPNGWPANKWVWVISFKRIG